MGGEQERCSSFHFSQGEPRGHPAAAGTTLSFNLDPACTRATPPTAWTDGQQDRAQGDKAGSREGSASRRLMSCLLNNSEEADGWRPQPPMASVCCFTSSSAPRASSPIFGGRRHHLHVLLGQVSSSCGCWPPCCPPRTVALPQGGDTRQSVHTWGTGGASWGCLGLPGHCHPVPWGAQSHWVSQSVPTWGMSQGSQLL